MKSICYQCGNPRFGMVRYYRLGKVFCKMSCRNNYTQGKARVVPQHFECAEEKAIADLIKIIQYP